MHYNYLIFSQRKDGVSHLLQTDPGMEKFLWQQCYFTHWPQGSHHAFPFGNINSNCVHIAPPSDWIWPFALSSLPVQSPG